MTEIKKKKALVFQVKKMWLKLDSSTDFGFNIEKDLGFVFILKRNFKMK